MTCADLAAVASNQTLLPPGVETRQEETDACLRYNVAPDMC